MSDLLSRIADYFKNDYQGEDKTAPTMEITVNDLRYIASMNVDRCKAEAKLRNIEYNKGCAGCKAYKANAIQEYIDKVVTELKKTMQDLNVIEVLSHIDFDSTIQNGLDNFLKAYNSELLRIIKQGGVSNVSDDVCVCE